MNKALRFIFYFIEMVATYAEGGKVLSEVALSFSLFMLIKNIYE